MRLLGQHFACVSSVVALNRALRRLPEGLEHLEDTPIKAQLVALEHLLLGS